MRILKKNKKKTIYFHIGTMKTGSSAIQNFVLNNRSYLKQNDLLYTDVNFRAQNYLAFSLMDKIPKQVQHVLKENKDELYEKLVEEILKSKQNRVLITTEIFSLLSTDKYLGIEVPKRLFSLLNGYGFEFKIILFLRKQDEFLLSMYNQIIKRHNFDDMYTEGIMTYYEDNIELFDYKTLLNYWAEIFGEKNLIIKPFLKGDNIVESFFEIFDINVVAPKIIENKSLGVKSIEFFKLANKYNINKSSGAANATLIRIVSDTINTDTKLNLSKEQSDSILEKYFKSNKEISIKYFNGDKRWFQTTSSTSDIESAVLEVSDVVKIATAIWNHYQK